MPTAAATKPAPKLPATTATPSALSKPSLLDAPDSRRLEKTECLLRVLAALAAEVEPDPEDVPEYRGFAADEGFTKHHEQFAIEALKSFGNLDCWPDEFQERLADVEADEAKWKKAEQEADLQLTEARNKRRAAQHDRENLLAEDRQVRHLQQVNPFLCGSIEQAAEAITIPALTRNEAAQIIGSRYQDWERQRAGAVKLHYAEREASAAK